MLFKLIFTIFFVVSLSQETITVEELLAQPVEANKLTGRALVDYVNKRQPFFEAEYSPKAEQRLKHLMKTEFIRNARKVFDVEENEEPMTNVDIPESFDSRIVWKNCSSITYIRDQSQCGSCWAVSAASTMSDRICVQTGGRVQKIISDVDILSCCGLSCGYGCDGGYAHEAWAFALTYGVVTGGGYKAKGVCRPYPFHPCGLHHGQFYSCPRDHEYVTPVCKKYCQYGYGKRYEKDKIFARTARILDTDEKAIQKEIMRNGPVQAAFTVYEDFSFYKKGIYVHTGGKESGGHAIKIIGWGVENGTKYWTIANSWHDDWGEDGYFRILRGVNHCDIESYVVAGQFRI
uniref:Pept_C1 domain-containing protein n=1 Tax=Haemonchus contortus TaxID=6289 RepID=A0A7I4Z561_HAECO|nr:Peptidase C1A domain containing protein [Haemonchus contortus]